MQSLVTVHNDVPVVSHRVIAENTGNDQKNIVELITRYKADFEEFGTLPFQTEPLKNGQQSGMSTAKTYLLNEPQATLLMTYMRNSEIVRRFKIALVKAFYELKEREDMSYKNMYEGMAKMLEEQMEGMPSVLEAQAKHPAAVKSKFLSPAVIRELKSVVSKEALDEFYQREVLGLSSVRSGCVFRISDRAWETAVSYYERRGVRVPPKDLTLWKLEDKKAFYEVFKDTNMIPQILGVWNWLHGYDGDPTPIYYDIAAAERRMRAVEELAAKL